MANTYAEDICNELYPPTKDLPEKVRCYKAEHDKDVPHTGDMTRRDASDPLRQKPAEKVKWLGNSKDGWEPVNGSD